MNVDVVVTTYNRAELLRTTLLSLLRHQTPSAMPRRVIVVNNRCSDNTDKVIEEMAVLFDGRLTRVFEDQPGLSHARNAGIRASSGDVIAFLDDDEEITTTWYPTLFESFQDSELSFLGGAILPNWKSEPPSWLPVREFSGVIGMVDASDTVLSYDENFEGILMGGNSAFRRKVFDQIGIYNVALGRGPSGLGAGEDHDLYYRLRAAKLVGRYEPTFAILHLVPEDRLTAKYFRRWMFGQAVSQGRMDRHAEEGVPLMLGIPRHHLGTAARSSWNVLSSAFCGKFSRKSAFLCELEWRRTIGLLCGTHRWLATAFRVRL